MRKLSEEEVSALKVLVLLMRVMNTKIPEAFLKCRERRKQ